MVCWFMDPVQKSLSLAASLSPHAGRSSDSRVRKRWPSHAPLSLRNAMAERSTLSFSPGHSGGAVPDSHRCSLLPDRPEGRSITNVCRYRLTTTPCSVKVSGHAKRGKDLGKSDAEEHIELNDRPKYKKRARAIPGSEHTFG